MHSSVSNEESYPLATECDIEQVSIPLRVVSLLPIRTPPPVADCDDPLGSTSTVDTVELFSHRSTPSISGNDVMAGDRILSTSFSEPSILKPKANVRTPSISSLSVPQLIPLTITHHAVKTALWISLAAIVGIIMSITYGRQHALEFLTAYIVEYSLSVDNLFVFLLIFRYFHVPREAQESVLTYGIIGAMLLRGIMIVCGKALVQRFEWVGILFAALLIYSAGKLLFEDDDDDVNLEGNRLICFSKKIIPVSDRYSGDRFFVRENSRLLATPLMVVLVSIELSDVVFALDSVPAVLGLSSNTFVIYASNILAIMGLRSLFFVLSSSLGNFRFLKQALAIVLGFIGIKMIAEFFGKEFGTALSLVFVAGTLVCGILLSIMFPSVPTSRSPLSDVNTQSGAGNV